MKVTILFLIHSKDACSFVRSFVRSCVCVCVCVCIYVCRVVSRNVFRSFSYYITIYIYRYNETGILPDVLPTCANFAPSINLDTIGCDKHVNFNGTAPWVYCADAICTPPVDGFANCKCWIQENSESIGPGSIDSGAGCVEDFLTLGKIPNLFGAELFEKMNEGELYSTFGGKFGNSSFLPEIALELCEPNTPFGKYIYTYTHILSLYTTRITTVVRAELAWSVLTYIL